MMTHCDVTKWNVVGLSHAPSRTFQINAMNGMFDYLLLITDVTVKTERTVLHCTYLHLLLTLSRVTCHVALFCPFYSRLLLKYRILVKAISG